MRRTDAKLDRIGKQLRDLGLVQGEVVEDLFFRKLKGGAFKKTRMDIKKVKRNLKAVDGRQILSPCASFVGYANRQIHSTRQLMIPQFQYSRFFPFIHKTVDAISLDRTEVELGLTQPF